jgi:hypothetical protein
MNTVSVTYCGMEGTGRNVTSAKQDAARKLESIMHGSYNPALLECRMNTILVWRDTQGWHSRVIQTPGNPVTNSPSYNWEGNDRDEAVHNARAHLAQLAWTFDDGLSVPRTDADTEIILTPSQREDFFRWAGFQLAYRDARKAGMEDCQAHEWACRNPVRAA